MKMQQISQSLISASMAGLCLVTGAKTLAANDFPSSGFVVDFSNLADSQSSMSSLVSNQSFSTADIPHASVDTITSDRAKVEQPFAIPSQFHGEWNSNLEHCGTAWGDSRLQIDANYIEFHESSGPVVEIVAQGDHDLTVTIELSGEGDTWLDERHFKLSSDLQALESIFDPSESGFVRYRCSS
ncbi:MAG: hypothetical protein KTR27_16260 [Leptolyngbyaceae cyanobacterium MAG.088]|nr:hypothetical protein [Leptolyngbyaceae cyanobacterium MAG.088]